MTQCPFCLPTLSEKILLENAFAYVVYDGFPVSPNHVLIIPKMHESEFLNLPNHVQIGCWDLLNQAREWLKTMVMLDNYNIGINSGEYAGQTVMHAHIHLIPRYKGDTENPRGGVRGVIPTKQSY